MSENVILSSIADLHTAMYTKMQTITGISGLTYKGFDSGRMKPALNTVALHISCKMTMDRSRPSPLESHRVRTSSGTATDYTVDGVAYNDVYDGWTFSYPLPVSLIYEISAWCHDAQTQLQLDEKILQTFPDRGILELDINGTVFQFPIELVGGEPVILDDLSENLLERLYRFRVEAYVRSHLADTVGKTILISTLETYEGSEIDDATTNNLLLSDTITFD